MSDLIPQNIPEELKQLRRWVLWKHEQRNGRLTKIPKTTAGRNASSTDSDTWIGFEAAMTACETGGFDGVGFVFSAGGNLSGVDLDDCIDDVGNLAPWAQKIVKRLDSYTETSPSGRGVHIIVAGKLPTESTRRRKGGVEMYDSGRYFCMTGQHLDGTPTTIGERTEALAELHRELFAETAKFHSSPSADAPVVASDDELIAAIKSNGDSKLLRLWRGETNGYRSPSEADLALCNLLVHRCGPDRVRIDRLFRRSGLMRPKWDQLRGRKTYGDRTIEKATEGATKRASAKPVDLLALPLTDYGNAQRLVLLHGSKLRHVYSLNRWYEWDRRRWQVDNTGSVIRFTKETFRHMAKVALKRKDHDALLKFARASENRTRIDAAVTLARSERQVVVKPEQLDADRWLLNVRNGTIELRSGELYPHRPEDLITKLAPVNYDPKATCPTFTCFLEETTSGRQDLAFYLQQLLGMCLTGDISEQILPVFYGEGANGKSTLLDLILYVMGDYAGLAAPDLLMARRWSQHPTEIADLWGKRLVMSIETERSQTLRTAFIKSITGDARLKGRFMRADFFEFDRTFSTILCTNNKPTISEQTVAIWRRLRLLPFTNVVPEARQDKRLLAKLKAEAAGVLAWMVRGCLSWQRKGLITPPDVVAATEAYRAEQDHHQRFADDCLTLTCEACTSSREIIDAYEEWCREAGVKPDLPSLWPRLKAWGCEDARTKQARRWRGVGLHTDGGEGSR